MVTVGAGRLRQGWERMWPNPAEGATHVHAAVDRPHDGVVRITLNRPDKLNAMNAELIDELHDVLIDIAADTSCRVVLLTGSGRGILRRASTWVATARCRARRASAGWRAPSPPRRTLLRSSPDFARCPSRSSPPSTGRPRAAAWRWRWPATSGSPRASARFNVAFVRLGISGCDIGVSWLLPRLVGASRAWELMLTGRIIGADEADRIGLVLRVVPDDELLDAALETAGFISANSPWGIRMTKEVMWSQLEVGSLQAGIDLENRTQVLSSMTGDMQEAVAAFLEKRPPRYGSTGTPSP